MIKHLVLTTATSITAATTGTAATAVSGDSLTVRNYGRAPKIVAAWQTNQTAGFGQLVFPTGHDTTRGIRVGVPAALTGPFLSPGIAVDVTPQEVLAVTIGATAVANDIEQLSFLTGYDVEQGQRFITPAQAYGQMEKFTTIEASLTSAAGPNYSGTELITADSDLLLANRRYAVLGFSCRTRIHCVGIVGPDTGNERIGQPITLRPEFDQRYFVTLSQLHGEAFVPTFNSGNRGATNFFCHTDENAGTFVMTAHLVLLK